MYDEEKIDRILRSDLNQTYRIRTRGPGVQPRRGVPRNNPKDPRQILQTARGSRDHNGDFVDNLPAMGTTLTEQADARHFDMPEHYEPELAIEIAKMIGLHLRDADMYNFSVKEEVPKPTK